MVRKPTYIELMNLLKFIEENVEDPHIIGVIPGDIESVRRFWNEYCYGMRYRECKYRLYMLFPKLFKRPVDVREAPELRQSYSDYFRVAYGMSDFWEVFDSYDILKPSEKEELEAWAHELLARRYGCYDIGVLTPGMIPVVYSKLEDEVRGLRLLFVPAHRPQELEDYMFNQIAVAESRDVWILYCYTGDDERPMGFPLAANKPVIFTSRGVKRYAIVK